jgi:asparagine synthase (glutamine-hydrolysing)
MGALAGWVAGAARTPDAQALVSMLESLNHRGEALSAYVSGTVVMGTHVSDETAELAIAFDGAILNRAELKKSLASRGYRFDSGSDAEIVLRAYQYWDKEVVKHLRGAFALALWDAGKERLLLARDRFGEKPLYLCEQGGALYFASETKALLRIPQFKTEVDVGAVGDYLRLGYVPGPRTLVSGIRKLAPGTYALWQFGRSREVRYWTPPDKESPASTRNGDPVDGFIERLDDAVHLAMQSEQPVGALLTGGFDSAAIVALMRKHSERVATFAAGFAEDKRSELPAAARVAKQLGTQHHEMVLAHADVLAQLPELVARRDAPFTRPADVALHLLATQAAKSVRVALTGDGSDEILGGYRRHTVLRNLPHGPKRMPGLFVIPVQLPEEPETGELRQILYYEQTGWLPDNLLERTDRMMTAAALEARAPFLDHRVAEYVSALPDNLRVRGLATKWILREADKRLLGDDGVKPRKAGFRIPVGELLRGPSKGLLDYLRGPGALTRSYYETAVLDRVLDEHLAAKRNHEELLWTLLNLEIWHRNLQATTRAAPA